MAAARLAEREFEEETALRGLTDAQWADIVALAAERRGVECPICMAPWGARPELALSCSHCFHAACLESFERFSAGGDSAPLPTCPVCRRRYASRPLEKAAAGSGAAAAPVDRADGPVFGDDEAC